jgi:hypothetical protein
LRAGLVEQAERVGGHRRVEAQLADDAAAVEAAADVGGQRGVVAVGAV